MQPDKIFIPAIAGTSAMTFFSYLVSESKDENFREPEVLAQLIKGLPKWYPKEAAVIAGWAMHYAVGIFFVIIYNELWKRKKIKPSIISGVTLGLVSGLVGVTAWHGTFKAHPNPPKKNLKRFFGHLILAHVVFGVFCSVAYKLVRDRKNCSCYR